MTIITLIHGTWARRAKWTKDTSPLAKALKTDVRDEVRIETFDWSGRNLHFMRRRAATRLQTHIRSLGARFPDARHFIVAHSHGGNIALYALSNPGVKPFVTGVVCLSTPFVQCRRRFFPKDTLFLLSGFYALALFLTVRIEGQRYLLADYHREVYVMGVLLPALLALPLVVAIAFALKTWLSTSILGHKGSFEELLEAICRSFDSPRQSSEQLLILRAPGDEATAALGASWFAIWIFGKLSSAVQVVHRAGIWFQGMEARSRWPLKIAAGLAIIFFVVVMSQAEGGDSLPNWLTWLLLFSMAFGVSVLLYSNFIGALARLLYLILAFPLLVVCSVFSIPFGLDTALIAWCFEFSAETTPVGTFSVLNLHAPTSKGLWHSLPHEDPAAFKGIVRWINHHRGNSGQQVNRDSIAVAIRNYVASRSDLDWREIQYRLDAVDILDEERAKEMETNMTSGTAAEEELRRQAIAILEETATLSRSLRPLSTPVIASQIEELQTSADRFEQLEREIGRNEQERFKEVINRFDATMTDMQSLIDKLKRSG